MQSEKENERDNIIPDGEPGHTAELRRYNISELSLLAVEGANVGTWLLDEKTKELLPSKRLKELFGYHADENVSYEGLIAQIDLKYRNKVIARMESAMVNREHFHMDFRVTGFHDQKQRWIKALGGMYSAPDEKQLHFSGVMMDITEEKQNELRKNKFIGMVSHELKTPLTSLKAYVQMLYLWAKKKKDNFAITSLSKVERQVKKMQNMINGFLNLSQAESGKIQLDKQDFDLGELINEVMNETRLLTSSHVINFLPCEPMAIYADKEKIEQVVINLFNNAIKYSPKQSVITVSCEIIDNKAQVCVTDEGIGIDRQDIDKLFKRYYRVENKHTENISGFGIGLYLCAEIIKHHHGSIWVESEVGKGSAFYFSLPLVKDTD